MNARVYVEKLQDAPESLRKQFDKALQVIGLAERARSLRSVFLKPNLTYPVYKKGVTTRVEFVRELVAALLRVNDTLKVVIGEGDGGYNSFSMSSALEAMGYTALRHEFPHVEIVNLSQLPTETVTLETHKGPYPIQLPMAFFDGIDVSISCPLPKVHAMTRVTLSLKNLWGCLPDVMRLKNHYMLPHIISRLARLLKFEYAFLDGKYGLNVNGPMEGEVLQVDWFVASNSLGAFDATVTEMMGFPPEQISHLNIARTYGLIPQKHEIEIIGELSALKTQFRFQRDPWTYPALLAFHSKHLTQFFYLSRYAGLLHDVMYLFRKRPIPPITTGEG